MSLDNRPEDGRPVAALDDLLPYFLDAEKPAARHQVGIEHEKVPLDATTLASVPFEGPRGIRELLMRAGRFGYEPILDHGHPIAARRERELISLEPGGQLEISGSPFFSLQQVASEHRRHVARMKAIGAELGITLLGIGYRPFGTVDEAQWMPKTRYTVMRDFMPGRGKLALDMMLMTGTVQTSLDFSDEQDCGDKVRAAAAVSSLVAALYANSPVVRGSDSGYQTWRYRVWNDVDPARCGLLPLYFDEEGFTYRRYAEWAIAAPMLFIRRSGDYVPMDGVSFARFMAEGHKGHTATSADFEDHMTTLFPEIRVKQLIEMRSADACDVETSNALPALFAGILYDPGAREAATALTADLSFEQHLTLQEQVALKGLNAGVGDKGRRTAGEAARELVRIAVAGLKAQGRSADTGLLDPLADIAESNRTPADRLLEAFRAGGPRALVRAAAL